jgi:hypothetical protein
LLACRRVAGAAFGFLLGHAQNGLHLARLDKRGLNDVKLSQALDGQSLGITREDDHLIRFREPWQIAFGPPRSSATDHHFHHLRELEDEAVANSQCARYVRASRSNASETSRFHSPISALSTTSGRP